MMRGVPVRERPEGVSVDFLTFKGRYYFLLCSTSAIYLMVLWGSVLFGKADGAVAAGLSGYLLVAVSILFPFVGRSTLINPVVFFVLWHELFNGFIPRALVYLEPEFVHRAIPLVNSNWVLVKHSMLNGLFLLCVFLGYIFSRRVKGDRLEWLTQAFPSKKLVLWVTFVAVLISFAYLTSAVGGLSTLLMQRGLARSERVLNTMEAGPFVALVRCFPYLCVAWLAVAQRAWRDPIWVAIFVTSILMAFFISGSRGGMIIPIIVFALVLLAKRKRKSVNWLSIAAGSLFLLFLFGAATDLRQQSFGKPDPAAIEIDLQIVEKVQSAVDTMSAYSVDGDASFAVLARVPSEFSYIFGASYLSVVFAPVPSIALPFDKPAAGGALAAETFFFTTENTIPPKHVGEAFWNFSYPGVVFVALGFGFVMGAFYKTLRYSSYAPGMFVVYLILVFVFTPTSDSVYSVIRNFVPVVLFLMLVRGVSGGVKNAGGASK